MIEVYDLPQYMCAKCLYTLHFSFERKTTVAEGTILVAVLRHIKNECEDSDSTVTFNNPVMNKITFSAPSPKEEPKPKPAKRKAK